MERESVHAGGGLARPREKRHGEGERVTTWGGCGGCYAASVGGGCCERGSGCVAQLLFRLWGLGFRAKVLGFGFRRRKK